MRLQTLGGLKLEPSDFHRPKPLLLLAYLAVEGAKDRRHLAELFWPEAIEPATSLRVALGQLRKGAAEAVSDDGSKLSLGAACDATELLGAIRDHHLERVPTLYAGAFLEGFTLPDWNAELEEWVYATREFIASQVRASLVRMAETEAARGAFERGASHAETAYRLRHARPLEPDELERLHGLLIAGDSPLSADLRREAEEFGLELRIATTEARARLAPNLPSEHFRTPPRAIPNNLPAARTSFIGRDPELVEVGNLLERGEARLVTLLGPGGIGKTRLALQVAHDQLQERRFQDGVYFVPLENLGSSDQVPRAIADALGVTVQGNTDPLEAVIGFVGNGVVLIALDNFEHLVSGAELASMLLERCRNMTLLATSRERLQLEEEFALPLAGLPVPASGSSLADAELNDAVKLFVQRAKRARIDFALQEADLPHVLEICASLEGSPLGLELAAAWVKVLPVSEIAREIRQNLDILETPARNAREGHRSLRAVFERSWALLSPRERDVLARLAVFHGGFTREAAGAVAGATIPVLASLVDKSLLRVDAEGRYDRHALVYQYALEKLKARPDELERACKQHFEFFMAFTEQAEPQLQGPEQAIWFERVEQELPNLRATLDWTIGQRRGNDFVRCTRALRYLWVFRGYISEGRAWLTRGLAEAEIPEGTSFRAEALSNMGILAYKQGDLIASDAFYLQSLSVWRTLERPINISGELNNLAINARREGKLEAARAYSQEALDIARDLGDQHRVSHGLDTLASVEVDLGRYASARSAIEESLEIQGGLGNTVVVANMLINLGEVIGLQGDLAAARSMLEEAVATHRSLGNPAGVAHGLLNLAAIVRQQSDSAMARACYAESLPILRELNDLYALPFALEGLATMAAPVRAARLWGAAEAVRETIGSPMPPYSRPSFEPRVAAARRALGDEAFDAAWAQGRKMTLEGAVAFALEFGDASSEAVAVARELG